VVKENKQEEKKLVLYEKLHLMSIFGESSIFEVRMSTGAKEQCERKCDFDVKDAVAEA